MSGFHKSVRAYNIAGACYYALAMCKVCGEWKCLQYMYMMNFEETLSNELYKELGVIIENRNYALDESRLMQLVTKMCLTTKKWYLKSGHKVYFKEYELYKKLKTGNREYEPKESTVTKWVDKLSGTISSYKNSTSKMKKIGVYNVAEAFALVEDALKERNEDKLIYGMAVLFDKGHNKSKVELYKVEDLIKECLEVRTRNVKDALSLLETLEDNNYNYMTNSVLVVVALLVLDSIEVCNEKWDLSKEEVERLMKYGANTYKRGGRIEDPISLNDEHTEAGRSKLQNTDICVNREMLGVDLRFSGNWLGVFWRCSCVKQGKDIYKSKWEDVKCTSFFGELVEDLEEKCREAEKE